MSLAEERTVVGSWAGRKVVLVPDHPPGGQFAPEDGIQRSNYNSRLVVDFAVNSQRDTV